MDMDDGMPRRPRRAKSSKVTAAKAVAIEPEPNFVSRVLLHSPKDTMAAAVAVAASLAIMINALFLQPGRHPSPMFGASADQATVTPPAATPVTPPAAQPLPRQSAEVKPADAKPAELKPLDQKIAAAAPAAAKSAAPAAPNVPRPPAAIPGRNDPIGDLVMSNRRVAQVQRALTEYGYGQLKPNGVAGADTQAAIRKFEHDRRKPETGQMSDWLVHEIVKLTGRPID